MMAAYAISRADLVIIPTQAWQLDANQPAKAVMLIKQRERAFLKNIPFAILYPDQFADPDQDLISCPELVSKELNPSSRTHLHEREAFGGTLLIRQIASNPRSRAGGGLENANSNARTMQLNSFISSNQHRSRLFGEDLDLSQFMPSKPVKAEQPPPETVRATAESANFQSREVAKPPKPRQQRRSRVGRNIQLNTKATMSTRDGFYEISDRVRLGSRRNARKGAENSQMGT